MVSLSSSGNVGKTAITEYLQRDPISTLKQYFIQLAGACGVRGRGGARAEY